MSKPSALRPLALRLAVAYALAAVGVGAAGVAVARSSRAAPTLPVLGFQMTDSPPALIDRNAGSLAVVGVAGIEVDGPGRAPAPDRAALAQRARAAADGLPAVLLVGNWSDRLGDFSEPLAHETLGDASAVATLAQAVAGYVQADGFDGVSVDLESLLPRDAAGLTAFVADLRADLPAASSLTVCVSAFTSLDDYAANGYDLRGLAANADQIALMTYDLHGPWEKTPGPIGPLPWQRTSVAALERVVPPAQIFLGAADYAYAWRQHEVDSLSVSQARALVSRWHASARWVPAAGEWTARLRDGSTVWWSDARSIRRRLVLARRLGVHGVAVWALGTGDPIPPQAR